MRTPLRDYQEQAIESLREQLREDKRRLILCAPTGAGKTVMAAALIHGAMEKAARVAFVADREALVLQTSDRLFQAGLNHGITMSDQTRGRSEKIQVCSAQTLEKRGFWPDLDLLIVDEAHCMRKFTTDFAMNSNVLTIGLTATPFTRGLGKIYQGIVNARTTDKLIDDGWLAPLRVFTAKQINMAGAATQGGEWTRRAAEERALPVTGDIVTEWVDRTQREFGGAVKTICFSATVAHGDVLRREFNDAGFRFEQISYLDRDAEDRKRKIRALERGLIDGLISCEALAKGFDVPDIRCVISARPYRKSLAGVIQSIGRGMRAAPDKSYAVLLDHCRNFLRFAPDIEAFWEHGWSELDSGEKKPKNEIRNKSDKTRECRECKFVMPAGAALCPACGAARPARPVGIEIKPGVMVEYRSLRQQVGGDLWPHVSRIAVDRYPGDSPRALKFARAQYKSITGGWPGYNRPLQPVEYSHKLVLDLVDYNIKKYLREKKRMKR